VTFEAAAAQITAREPRVRVLEQSLVIKVDCGLHRFVQSLLAFAFGRKVRVVVAKRDVRARRESFDCFDEVEVLDFTNERDRVTALVATEAVKDRLVRAHRKRRRLLGMERTQSRVVAANALQRDVLAYERDEVGGISYSRHILVEDPHNVRLRGVPTHYTPLGKSLADQPRSSTPSASA